MPDVAAAERFISDVARLETRATKQAEQLMRAGRLALLEELSRNPANITSAMARLGEALAAAHAPIAREAAQTALRYATVQIPETGTFVDSEPAQQGLGVFSAWQAATVGRFLADAARLQSGGLAGEALALALVAIAGDRQSAWAWALGALSLAAEGAIWQTSNGTLMATYRAAERSTGQHYQKQAIAAIDSRTTNCCLQVHGQIKNLDIPFHLSGSPRFASALMAPPFHFRCRTVMALYTPAMERTGILTLDMRQAARAELSARTGKR